VILNLVFSNSDIPFLPIILLQKHTNRLTFDKVLNNRKYFFAYAKSDVPKISKIVTKNFLKSELDKIEPENKFREGSLGSRLLGLWLWDKCKSPQNKNKIKVIDAIKMHHDCGDSFDESVLRRYLQNATDSIKKGVCVPF